MDIAGIIKQLLFPIALVMALVIIGISCVSYALYKKRGGNGKLAINQYIAIFLLLGWFVVVIELTTLSRPAYYQPVYRFKGLRNGESLEVLIPAI